MNSGILAAGFVMNVVAVLFVICALILMLVILLQKGKGGGIGAAFGGGGGGLLGTKTGDFLTWLTIFLAGLFLLLAVVMAKWYRPAGPVVPEPAAQQQQQQSEAELPGEPQLPIDDTELPE